METYFKGKPDQAPNPEVSLIQFYWGNVTDRRHEIAEWKS